MSIDAPILTRRNALEMARDRLTSVVAYCLDLGLEPDAMDKDSIRKALDMVNLALQDTPQPPEPGTLSPHGGEA